MEIIRNGITVFVSDHVLTQLVLDKLRDDEPAKPVQPGTLPRIGAEVVEMGGVFAGVARGANGAPDYYLIVGPTAPSTLEWQKAIDWAEGVEAHGFDDFTLPTRKEQALMFANLPELFEKEWYWSSEQLASLSYYAWAQIFYDGFQSYSLKVYDFRARAVRRVPI